MKRNTLTRRNFLGTLGTGLAAAALPRKAAAAEKPNVIILFSDDQGTIDLNCFGARDLYTPRLDGLAARGVRFTQFYLRPGTLGLGL